MVYSEEFNKIEVKWQKEWSDAKIFETKEDKTKKKCYVLEMYPYPSGTGLHIGHAFNYTIGDIYSRFKRMAGFNVLYPMGYDSFGLPAENAAIKNKSHPKKFTDDAINYFMQQQKLLGLSYDWSRLIKSHDPNYYKWDQWIFLQMYKNGLVYKKKSPINWCPKCNTVLANEQVHNGKCWRHLDTNVEIKHLEQWFFKTTKYADELYETVDNLNWPDRIKAMQKNWIGKSHGTEIEFDINNEKWPIFTTRPDTIFGVTFLVVSAQHARLNELITKEQKEDVEEFLKKINSTSEKDLGELEKEGVFTGSYAINPVTKEKVPVYAGNFVLADYGAGMVMAVPAHDQRDFEFAKKYNIPIKEVIMPVYGESHENEELRHTISAVIHRKKDNKFLLVKWKQFNWVSPVVGGIEENEDILKTAEREVFEETGYKTKAVKLLGGKIESHFYADNKKVWRHRLDQPVLLELVNDKPENVEDHEKNKHEEIWLTAEDAIKQITHEYNKLGLQRYLGIDKAYTDDGILVNSGEFTGLNNRTAITKISEFLESKKLGKRVVNYKLRDWLVSRQRFWGTPIPVVYCDNCGIVTVPEKDLPVVLPENMILTNEKGNPLASNSEFVNTTCPKCGAKAKRETDTMDTFVNSSWYFLRFTDNHNTKEIFDKNKVDYWLPIDMYIGGAEHACMHLIYCRFYTKFLRDIGLLKFDEPITKLFNQGMLHGEDGFVMSKSRGNVIDPIDTVKQYGADTLRLFLVSIASPDKDSVWSNTGIASIHKFVSKVYDKILTVKIGKSSKRLESKLNKAIKEITLEIENVRYNVAIIKLRQLFDVFELEQEIAKSDLDAYVKMISPFCPHLAEELWHKLGNKDFISKAEWPKCDEKKIDEKADALEDMITETINDIRNVLKVAKIENPKTIEIIVADSWKYEFIEKLKAMLEKTNNAGEIIKSFVQISEFKQYGQFISKYVPNAVNDRSKLPLVVFDSETEYKTFTEAKHLISETFNNANILITKESESKLPKAKFAMPGKPGVFIE